MAKLKENSTILKSTGEEIIATEESVDRKLSRYGVASGTNTYTVTIPDTPALTTGLRVTVKFTNANTTSSSLNINGLGAKPIVKAGGAGLNAGNIKANGVYTLVYDGTVFQLQGEGGEYGTAQASDVLAGKTIGTENGIVTGTMPNRGAVTNTITTQGGSYIIPAGYHNGSGKVIASFANLVPENIKLGVNIGGVVGTLIPASTLIPGTNAGTQGVCQISFSASASSDYVRIGRLAINLPGTYGVYSYFNHSSTGYGGSVSIKRGDTTLLEYYKSYNSSGGSHFGQITTIYGDILDVFHRGERSTTVYITLALHPDTFATKL